MAERTTRTDESLNTADHSARSGSVTAQLIRLSLPLILSNILQQFYNTIDTWMVGRYAGPTAFASMGIAGSLMNLFMFIVIGACTGISIMFAQLYGAEDLRHFRQEHYQMLAVGTIAALVLSAGGLLSLSSLIRIMQTPGDMVLYVTGYLSLILAGLPLTYLYNYYNGLLRAVGNARVPLFILAGATILNLIMDYLLVGVLSMGTRGAAIATILSQGFSAALCILYLMRCHREFMFRRPDMRISGELLRKTCALALVTGLHQTGLYIGKMLVQCAVNICGADMIAAYTATTRIEAFINSFGDSGAAATSVVAGQAYGAGSKDRVRRTFICSAGILTAFGIACSVFLWLTAPQTSAFMLSGSGGEAFTQAVGYLRLVSFFYMFCFLGNTFAGYYNGIGSPKITFMGSASQITIRVILSFLWLPGGSLRSLALATGLGWMWCCLFWSLVYLKTQRGGTRAI